MEPIDRDRAMAMFRRIGQVPHYHNYYLQPLDDVSPGVVGCDTVIILKPESDFHRVLFMTSDPGEFRGLLAAATEGRDVCLNCMVRGEMPAPLEAAITPTLPFFKKHVKLTRSCVAESSFPPDFATEAEIDLVDGILRSTFCKYDTFLPSRDVLLSYLRDQTVLVSRNGGAFDGLLVYTHKGRVAHSNFIYYRGGNPLGAVQLEKAMNGECVRRGIKNIFLWIDPANLGGRLLAMKLKAGCTPDGTVNYFYKVHS